MMAESVEIQALSYINLENQKGRSITWKAFQNRYLTREDQYKYEWVNSRVEKTTRGRSRLNLFITFNLEAHFQRLKKQKRLEGSLITEPDLFFLSNHRRPDFAWLTKQQIYSLAEPDAYEVPRFVIEVVSTNDNINKVKEKMVNYGEAGVEVVWHIFPQLRQVDVYTGTMLHQMTVCKGADICSATPALPDFQIKVDEIFYKP